MPDPQLQQTAIAAADRYQIPRDLFLALIQQESGFNPRAVSPKGAQGLGQLLPGTAAGLGVSDPFDPAQNLDGAARYFAQQLRTFGDERHALAAYNAGPGAVQKYGGIPPYPETVDYVNQVFGRRGRFAGVGLGPTPSPPPAVPSLQDTLQAIRPGALLGTPFPPASTQPRSLVDVPLPQPQPASQPAQFLTDVPFPGQGAPSSRTANLIGANGQVNLSPALQQQQAVAAPDPAAALQGRFPASPDLPAQLATAFRGLNAADYAVNAGAASVAHSLHERGAGALLSGQTYANAQAAALGALISDRATPPTAARNLLGLEPGLANRAAYDTAAAADYLLSTLTAPSNLILGPAAETLGGPIRGALGRVAGPILDRLGSTIAERAPGLARFGSQVGEALGIGPGAQQVRDVARPFRVELANRLGEAGQIGREVRDTTVALRKASPAFDDAEQAFAAGNGGTSRLQDLIARYVTVNQAQALREAVGAGIDPSLVRQFGDRLLSHADDTLSRLVQGGAVTPHGQGGPPLFVPGSSERRGFLGGYLDAALGRPLGATAGATPLGADAIRRSAVLNLTAAIASDGSMAAPLGANGALLPGWSLIPDEARYGSLAGLQIPATLGRFVASQVEKRSGGAEEQALLDLGRKAYLSLVNTRKKGILLGNPVGLLTTTGARLGQAEIAAKRAGVPFARVLGALPAAAREMAGFLRTGAQSVDMQSLGQYTPAFTASFRTMVEEAAPRVGVQAGTSGNILRVGDLSTYIPADLAQRVFSSGAAAHGVLDQLVKLALYKSLVPKLGAQAAAQQVEKHLFDYGDQPALLEALNRWGVWSFNAWPFKATKLTLETLLERPDLVARYPKIRSMLMQDIPGAQQDYSHLPAYRQGPFTLPLGNGRFANVARWLPVAPALELAESFLPSGEESGQTIGDKIAGKTLFGSAVENLGWNRSPLTGQPIAPPGAPPDVAQQDQLNALREEGKPSIQRGIEHIQAAAAGQTLGQGRYAEPQPLGEAVAQYGLGVPIAHAEAPQAKQERLAPQVQARADAASAFLQQLDQQPNLPNPYSARLEAVTDARRLQRKVNEIRQYLRSQMTAAANFDPAGRLTEQGQAQVKKTYLYLKAVAGRLQALGGS